MALSVEQLQHVVTDQSIAVGVILQKAILLANERKDQHFLDWARRELNGYNTADEDADHRLLKGQYVVISSDGRTLPIIWDNEGPPVTTRFLTLPLAEMEALFLGGGDTFAVIVNLDPRSLTKIELAPSDRIGFSLTRATLSAFLHAIRQRVLDWTMTLTSTAQSPQQIRRSILQVIDRLQGDSSRYPADAAIANELAVSVQDVRGHLGILHREGWITLNKTMWGHDAGFDPRQRQLFRESLESHTEAPMETVTEQTDLQVVLLIHGIRTQAEWQQMVAKKLEVAGKIKVFPIMYGFFDALRFWCPVFTRSFPINRVLTQIRVARDQYPNAKVSIIAHSFGTYVIGHILQSNFDIKFHRIVLCGSVLPQYFPWERILRQITPENIVNECGSKDIWPVIAQCSTWGYGASGTYGFGVIVVKDRYHEASHSQYFFPAFVDEYWIPLIHRGEYKDTEFGSKRPTTPLLLSLFGVLPINYIIVACFLLLMLLLGGHLYGRIARSDNAIAPPQLVLPDDIDLANVAFVDHEHENRAPRLDLKLTNMGSRPAFITKVKLNVKRVWRLKELPTTHGSFITPEYTYLLKLNLRDDPPYTKDIAVSHGMKPDEFERFLIEFQEEGKPTYAIYWANVEIIANSDERSYKSKDVLFFITDRGTAFPDKRGIEEMARIAESLSRKVDKQQLLRDVAANKAMIVEAASIQAARNPALEQLINAVKMSDINSGW